MGGMDIIYAMGQNVLSYVLYVIDVAHLKILLSAIRHIKHNLYVVIAVKTNVFHVILRYVAVV